MIRKRRGPKDKSGSSGGSEPLEFEFVNELEDAKLSKSLSENKAILKDMFRDCSDVVLREFEIEKGIPALAVLVDGLAKTDMVDKALEGIMILEGGENRVEDLMRRTLTAPQTQLVDNYKDLLSGVLSGDTAVLLDGDERVILLGIRGSEKRSVAEPETESVIRGPKEGFIESLRTNTSLLRRKLKTPHLKMKPLVLGEHSNTNIVITYVEGLAHPEMVEEVEKRLRKIKIDAIFESGYIEELIQDNSYSPFPQVQYTERPDTLAAALMQGRIGIISDGTPFVLIVPLTFPQLLQASEDYYERFQIATLTRWLRYLFVFISLLTPGLYVAITTFHPELLPTTLLLSIATAREPIPFPAVVEALIMEVTFEALREAGIRLPKTVGSAVSILGALVVGQAAVQAGIVSAPMVIVVSITGIASFTIPRFNGAIAIRMLRFPIIIAASLFGIYGILIAALMILGHMANLRSFGVPYLSPVGPLMTKDMDDVWIRAPWWAMRDRPSMLSSLDKHQMDEELPKQIARDGGQTGERIDHEDRADPKKAGKEGENPHETP